MDETKKGADRRAAPRIKTFQPAELIARDGARQRVHLLNLSRGGAMVYSRTPPERGAQVHLVGSVRFGPARVAWRSERCFGISFDHAIADTSLAEIVRAQSELVQRAAGRPRSERAA